MNEPIDQAVSRVIEAMYEQLGDELTIDDLARTAMYSKFHFSRAFRRVTGVSPGRFLSALRFQEAKRLLTGTSLSVAEISNVVGYSSLGTFSTRFKRKVGVTPTDYRRSGGKCCPPLRDSGQHGSRSVIRGQVNDAGIADDCGRTFVGLFPSAVPQDEPVRYTMLNRPGPYVIEDVPEGTWYLLAHGVVDDLTGTGDPPATPAGSVGQLGPITVRAGAAMSPVELRLRPMRTVDLPVVFAPFVTRPGNVRRQVLLGRATWNRHDRQGWPPSAT